ncbi:hypothetical protein PS2_001584 [Malus domestica]
MVPDVDRDSLPCLIKVHGTINLSDLKLNEVFEFVGVFTFDSEFKEDKDESDDFTNGFSKDEQRVIVSEGDSSRILGIQGLLHVHLSELALIFVPRLHCFIHRKLAAHDFLPCSPTIEPKPNLVKEIRESLLRHLTAVVGNDGIAANFMLLHLLSKLGLALKNLLPFTQCISLTVDYLKSQHCFPCAKKGLRDQQVMRFLSLYLSVSFVLVFNFSHCSRLITGALQLAEGSHMIFDETRLEAGILNSVGVENARLLKTLIESQKVEYDFKFYKLDMPADIQILVLSEGKSNILPADVVLPFHPSSVASVDITAEALEAWRWYLASLRSLPHSIEPEIQKVIENDLVAARQEDRTLGTQDFSRLLTMGRLMSMSFGETSLSLEHWQMVKELERLRRERLK